MRAIAWGAVVAAATLMLAACTGSDAPNESVTVDPPVSVELSRTDPEAGEKVLASYEAARTQPNDARARGQLGMAYEINGFREAAKTSYSQAAQLDPDDPRWSYLHALSLAADGEIESALTAMDESLAIDDLYVPGHLYRARWLLDTGSAEEAEASYHAVLNLDPGSRSAQLGLARSLIRQQRPAEAIELLQTYAAERPNDAYAYQLLGTAYRELGDLERAAQALARGRADARPSRWPDPRAEEKLRFVAGYGADMLQGETLLGQGQTRAAITVFEALLTLRPDDVQVINNLAAAYRRDGQVDRGLALLLGGVEEHPDYFPFYMNLSAAFQGVGDLERALESSERAIELNPTLAPAHQRRGRLLIELDRPAEALEAYETAISYEPDNRINVTYAGMLAAELGQCERAVRWLEKTVVMAPKLLPGFVVLGQCKAKLGDFAGAEAALDKAEELHPDSKDLADTRRLLDELKSQGS